MNELPKRKSNRLQNYDYSQNGAYFVTICSKDRAVMFGHIVGADTIRPQLTDVGITVEDGIKNINEIHPNVIVDCYVVMPNHIHLIIMVNCNGVDGRNENNGRIISAPTISTIVGYFKQFVSKKIGFSPWQKSFHDHIIRNEFDYVRITEYIQNNPVNWTTDCFYVRADYEHEPVGPVDNRPQNYLMKTTGG